MRLFGLIGYPLTHSFSKKFFTEKFLKEGLTDCRYELFSIDDISKLDAVLQQHPQLLGINVTIPYKQQVIPYLSSTTNLPAGVKACNCIRIESGALIGYNTDVVGFEQSFAAQLQPHHSKALVLGNGGATEAVVYVLKKLGISFDIVSRTLHQGSTLTYSQLTEKILSEASIIINTTPVGTFPAVEECPSIPYQFITEQHYLYDLVYNPTKTLFLQKGEEQGATIKNGYDMLVIQAEESWKIWNQ
jgi:shikimate dehydrogenase